MSDQTKKHAHAATAALRGAGFPSLKTTATAEVVGIFTSHIKPAHIDAWTDQQQERTVWCVKLLVPETSIPNGSRLYTAPPVPRDVAMAFGVEVAELCARHWTSGNCEELAIAMRDDISAIADHYAAQPSAATTTQLSGNSGQLPAVAVPNGYAQGVEAVAKMLEKKASDHASQYGYDDMGSLSFGRGQGGERKNDYYNSLLELAEEARAMLPAGMRPSGYAVVRMAALIEVAQLIDPEPIEVDGKLMVYRNPMAAEALAKISKAVRTMLAPIPNPAGETCENGQPDCGPVAHHDIEGVPLCSRCFDLEDDAPKPKGGE